MYITGCRINDNDDINEEEKKCEDMAKLYA